MKNSKATISATQGTVNNQAVTQKTAIRPAIPSNGTALTPSAAFEEVKKEENAVIMPALPAVVTVEPPKEEAKAVQNEVNQPTAEATKMEIKEDLQESKPARNLDSTVKLVLDLNRRINQRGKLLETIENLESFEIKQHEDADETETNRFSRCMLTIEDDKGNEFTTKNTFIISAVAAQVLKLCSEKLGEIEGEIFIPA
ncbi:hypothetical protein DBR43_03665 [Pedobacter sp. KBW06]|uniref:hypothetical protein n=1 Tax=Pedobacter sp. KBW06 TaxID=2153359 RepID=UPI000F5ABEFC|nr:hypothetical protein [Pedobacter sp. KBW06]RQO74499.1 hypothetical protein DBR43_03665 [Pedobacter sp. KBW06]